MKRVYQLVAAALVALFVPLAISGSASAASTCEIGFTGPDSQNMCTSIEKYSCDVTNDNKVTITNTNTQTGVSGAALNNTNTNGAGATTGTVSNTNGTTFSVVINNGATEGEASVCTAAVIVPSTPVPETAVVTPTSTARPAALPVTSGDTLFSSMGVVAGIVAATALSAAGAVIIYRRLRG